MRRLKVRFLIIFDLHLGRSYYDPCSFVLKDVVSKLLAAVFYWRAFDGLLDCYFGSSNRNLNSVLTKS